MDVYSVDIVGMDLNDAVTEDLQLFGSLQEINASENQLRLETLRNLPYLRFAKMACNLIRDVEHSSGMFPLLESLDLSYNQLSPSALTSLSKLPKLKTLNLACNELRYIPSFDPRSNPHLDGEPFPKLEELNLEDNKILNAWEALPFLQRHGFCGQ